MTAPVFAPPTLDTGLRPRRAEGHDLPMLVETLVAAFADDPVMTWWVPDPQRRLAILRTMFEITCDVNQPYGGLSITDHTPVAGAVCVPAGCQPTGAAAGQLLGWYLEAAEETSDRLLAAFTLMEEAHPEAPHDYLFFIGTRPEWQCRGFGSALLRDMLGRCDQEGRPMYLEATSEANRQLYLRHGFAVTGEIRLPDGPSMWSMWREPVSRGGQR